MEKNKTFTFIHMLIFILISLSLSVKSNNVYEIGEDFSDTFKTVSFSSDEKTINHYFKYTVKDDQKSKIDSFRIDFDNFNDASLEKNEVFCNFLEETTSDDALVEEIDKINSETTSCIGQFNNKGVFEGIIKYDEIKTKLAIVLKAKGEINFKAQIYIHTTEQILDVEEKNITIEESNFLIPFTISTSKFFENSIPKILLYSYNKELQIYYQEKNIPYPKKLFSGNILLIYTDPIMIHQKYHDAESMFLLARDFAQEKDSSSEIKFQIIFPKDYLLDYYVSNNPNGRSKNSPLAINMNECETPYYFILNYNKPEKEISLYIDQIYGKISSLSVSTNFSSNTWEEMIQSDMQSIKVSSRKFILPKESSAHIDVYRLECQIPLLLNFYYVDEEADIPLLDYGQVAITTLKSFQMIYFPFNQGISEPELTIEIFNPITLPLIYVNYEENEIIVRKNYLMQFKPNSTESPIIIKEKGGYSDTRIIIKVGYNTKNWEEKDDNLYYNSILNMHVFSFPNDESKLNYTYANLITEGVNEGDNVKYCYGTNLGNAILPSDENCYRISKNNPITLKFLNPFVMYKDYDIDENSIYYISVKPVVVTEKMEITPELYTHKTKVRNFEGVANVIMLDSTGLANTVLSQPKDSYMELIFVQIQNCDLKQVYFSMVNAYNDLFILSGEIPEGEQNFSKSFNNTLSETLLQIEGESNSKVFIKHTGIYEWYSLKFKGFLNVDFDSDLSELKIERPFDNYEEIKYTIFISKSEGLSTQNINLCSFTENKIISIYNKTITTYRPIVSISINFKKLGFELGEKFEVLVYYEQQSYTKMSFLSEIFDFIVTEPKLDDITEIKNIYEEDNDYAYVEGDLISDKISYYYSYLPEKTLDIPFGALSIELNTTNESSFRVDCAFVDEEDNAKSMVDAIQNVIDSYNSYCLGGRSNTKRNTYNYIFRYEYNNGKPRKLIIKISNENSVGNTNFTIYIRKEKNIYIDSIDKEYGQQDENKKSVVPYIFDLEKIREAPETDYISKILIYSQHFDMQMYYLDESGTNNSPRKIFSGNVMLVYTNPSLALEKYQSTKLILLTEDILGQEHPSSGINFRFHTKMFNTDAKIEYFLFNNVIGFSLSYPLSLQINTCTKENNKHYYIINYQKPLNNVTLYLDVLYGSMKSARISTNLNVEKWDDIIFSNMEDINEYQISLANRIEHIHIIEIECKTPLLTNVYLNYDDYYYYLLKSGNFVIKTLNPKESKLFTIDTSQFHSFYYSLSLFNSFENPDITISYNNIEKNDTFKENSLYSGKLDNIPSEITVVNNGETATRFIYKLGYGVESEWSEEKKNIEGKLYSKNSIYVYKFPTGENKKNFTDVLIDVKPMKTETDYSPNIKFCYSVSIGIPIEVSYENCFRTGENMPYTLTFLNPLLLPKNYKSYSNDYYYITLSSYYQPFDFITVDIKENKYNINERNSEGIGKVIKLENNEKSFILSSPNTDMNKNSILLQMQLCSSSQSSIHYKIIDTFTKEEIADSNLDKKYKFFNVTIDNLIENELKLIGNKDDVIFIKHTGFNTYDFKLQEYKATFDEKQKVVIIDKPILDEAFNITILIGKKKAFNDFTLCTLTGKSESQYKDLADYAKTIQDNTNKAISYSIDFSSFGYKGGDEFDLLVYAVGIENSKIEVLYDIISGKVEKGKNGKSNLVWIIPVTIVMVLIIVIATILLIRHYKKKNNIDELMNEDKETPEKERILPLKEV